MDGEDPCQLFIDALDSLAPQLDAILEAIAFNTEQLAACRMEHPINPPPMAQSRFEKLQRIEMYSEIMSVWKKYNRRKHE